MNKIIKNEELIKYQEILCNDYPNFIDKYFNTPELHRLKNIGLFCGCDYVNVHKIKYWYSRFDHSVSTALMTWHFTHNKTQTIAALFHDVGTPVLSHTIDYLLGDSSKQETSEKNEFDIISKSPLIKMYLESDDINILDLKDNSVYPIVENNKPNLCVDRLDGILSSALIWQNTLSIDEIKDIYKHITVSHNKENKVELAFNNIDSANTFYQAAYYYSIGLQSNDDKYVMQYMADQLKMLINNNIITIDDLYHVKEDYIIKLFSIYDPNWEYFTKLEKEDILRTEENIDNEYCISVQAKKRYVDPLVSINNQNNRLSEISPLANKLINDYKQYNDSKYCYVKSLKRIGE